MILIKFNSIIVGKKGLWLKILFYNTKKRAISSMWTAYLKNFESFHFTIEIPVNSDNYQSLMLDFDSFFLRRGYQWGMYTFVSVADNKILPIDTLIETYVSDRKKSFLYSESPGLSLLGWYDWELYREKHIALKEWTPVMTVPVKEEKWIDKNFSLSDIILEDSDAGTKDIRTGNTKIWSTYSYYSIEGELENIKEKSISLDIYSNSNIWFDEFDMTFIKDDPTSAKGRPVVFDKPIDNRSTAYRVTPRFNSFWRDIKQKVLGMSGKVDVEQTCNAYVLGLVNQEGYILLDGKVVFQEDIENGSVQLPD